MSEILPTELIYIITELSTFTTVLSIIHTCKDYYESSSMWSIALSRRLNRRVYIYLEYTMIMDALYDSLYNRDWMYTHEDVYISSINSKQGIIYNFNIIFITTKNYGMIRKYIKYYPQILQYIYNKVHYGYTQFLIDSGCIFDDEIMSMEHPTEFKKEDYIGIESHFLDKYINIIYSELIDRMFQPSSVDRYKVISSMWDLSWVSLEDYIIFEERFRCPKYTGTINSIVSGNEEVHRYLHDEEIQHKIKETLRSTDYLLPFNIKQLLCCNSVEIFNTYVDLLKDMRSRDIYSTIHNMSYNFFINVINRCDLKLNFRSTNFYNLQPNLFRYFMKFSMVKTESQIRTMIRIWCKTDNLDMIDHIMTHYKFNWSNYIIHPDTPLYKIKDIQNAIRSYREMLIIAIENSSLEVVKYLYRELNIDITHQHIVSSMNNHSPSIFRYLVSDLLYPELFELVKNKGIYEDIVNEIE